MTIIEGVDVLAALVDYPTEHVAAAARECARPLARISTPAADDLHRFAETVQDLPLRELQDAYISTFDFDPACSLELGWHLFGESFERGGFLVSLREDLEAAEVIESEALPDHLRHILSLLAREEPHRAARLAELVLPAIRGVREALAQRESPYLHLLAAIEMVVASMRTFTD
jgi:nitrate reductase delta subunit